MPTVNISQLPAPDVIETLDFETILEKWINRYVEAWPPEEQPAVRAAVSMLSDPVRKILEVAAYQDMILRQRVNDGARACMLAFAEGSDLEHLAAAFDVERLVVHPGDNTAIPPVDPVMETDDDLRARAREALDGISTAGAMKSYEFHARSADGLVADASAISPAPAYVTVTILSREGDGTASPELLNKVNLALNDETVRPVADRLTVQSANIVSYEIDAVLYLLPGPEASKILDAARQRVQLYTERQRRLGRDINLSAIYAACHVEGVQRVVLNSPTADQALDETQASWCTRYTLTVGGTNE
ncbi:baseplate J/gp47 family protein [Salmonella enterica]|nr:baseplate assembly protein [Salmonella enterica subsp. enterica serovar Pensacola]ECJ8612188.1 baseplate assembly protein [Salmonella enterica]EID1039442.1 baseplate J/gp47 family protein [Salmonella enterica]